MASIESQMCLFKKYIYERKINMKTFTFTHLDLCTEFKIPSHFSLVKPHQHYMSWYYFLLIVFELPVDGKIIYM